MFDINFFFQIFFFEIYCSQLTVDYYCSQLTVDCYCWSQYNRRLAIQFTHCTTKLQYNLLPTAIHLLVTIHLCIAIQFFHCTPLYCNTIFSHCTLLQYNSSTLQCIAIQFFQPLHTLAIQFQQPSPLAIHLILQYNFPANYTKAVRQFPSCNTISLAIQALLLQYNSKPKRLIHNIIWAVAQIGLHIFFFISSSYWKT